MTDGKNISDGVANPVRQREPVRQNICSHRAACSCQPHRVVVVGWVKDFDFLRSKKRNPQPTLTNWFGDLCSTNMATLRASDWRGFAGSTNMATLRASDWLGDLCSTNMATLRASDWFGDLCSTNIPTLRPIGATYLWQSDGIFVSAPSGRHICSNRAACYGQPRRGAIFTGKDIYGNTGRQSCDNGISVTGASADSGGGACGPENHYQNFPGPFCGKRHNRGQVRTSLPGTERRQGGKP